VASARAEYLNAVSYYADIEPGLSVRFADAVEDAANRALAFPRAGSPSPANTRRVLVSDFPFGIYFRPEANGIVIFAVAHHARRPGYWMSRVTEQ
jgi:plasmid stabilization system protein ParE